MYLFWDATGSGKDLFHFEDNLNLLQGYFLLLKGFQEARLWFLF